MDIHPEFQRFFRWTDEQKSKLIESLLLGIPIPSIFVSQRDDGVWDVIDGLQRLSTIFQCMGILRDEEGNALPKLTLTSTKYLPSLGGKIWTDDFDDPNAIEREHQLIIRRSKIDIKIILRESDVASKYELFQRLNSGGSPLSDQELRNCILIMVNRDFYHWLADIAKYESFRACIALTDRSIEEQYDVELVVRFVVFRKLGVDELREIGDIGEFLTDRSMALASDPTFDRDGERRAFQITFDYLSRSLGSDSFRRFDPVRQRFLGGFLLSAYEFTAIGVGSNYERYGPTADPEKARHEVQLFWSDQEDQRRIGSGVRASSRVPYTIPLGRTRFEQ